MSISGSLTRGLVAGICAGVLAALFAFVVAEPTIDRAIAIEEQRVAAAQTADQTHPAGTPPHEHAEVVSRDVQRRTGAPAGFIAAGAALGLLFGLGYAAVRRAGADRDHWHRTVALGASGVGAFLVVFLRYPPNPPGVGDPDTVDQRTRNYLAALLLGAAVVAGAWRLLHYLRARGWRQSERQALTAVVAVAVLAAGFAALPSQAEELGVPPRLLWDFRVQSLATQLVLWGGLTAVFGLLTERAARADR